MLSASLSSLLIASICMQCLDLQYITNLSALKRLLALPRVPSPTEGSQLPKSYCPGI
jgi:hypothetical protein